MREVRLYPIEKSDIFKISIGTKCGDVQAEKSGWFVSDFYVKEVMRTKVGQ